MKLACTMRSSATTGIGLSIVAAFFLASANPVFATETVEEVEEAAKSGAATEKTANATPGKPDVKAKAGKQPAKNNTEKNSKNKKAPTRKPKPKLTDKKIPKAESVDLEKPITKDKIEGDKKPAIEIKAAKKSTNNEKKSEPAEDPKAEVAAKEIPQAESIDLEKPVVKDKPKVGEKVVDAPKPPVEELSPQREEKAAEVKADVEIADAKKSKRKADKKRDDKKQKEDDDQDEGIPFILLGAEVPPGTATRLSWSPSETFEGIAMPTPVLVVNGSKPGPVLCLTAAVHGDELNGIEIVRRVLYNIDADKLAGAVIGVPIVNLQGFRRTSRYLTDRRDLNRFFPGNPYGSSAARIAHSFFNEVISRCSALVDLHTGSFYRTNLPQLRANLNNPDVVELTQGFGATVVLHSDAAIGTLRRSAMDAGIPAVTLEAGEPMRVQEKAVDHGVKGVQTLLNHLKMYKKSSLWGEPEPVYYQSTWVRADRGGILFTRVHLGKRVKKGDLLGTVTDPITNVRAEITSPHNGRVLGMALNQVVMPGFAAFRIGIQKSEQEITAPDDELNAAGDDSSKIEAAPAQKAIARRALDQRDNEDSE